MYEVPAHSAAVTLFSRAGEVRPFKSLKEALSTLGYRWIRQHVGANFREFSHAEYVLYRDEDGVARQYARPCYDEHEYILRGEFGSVVTADDFEPLLGRRRRRYGRYGLWGWNGEGPVPYTGRGGCGSYHRRFRTTAEKRMNQVLDAEEPRARSARQGKNLPDNWDDLARSDYNNKNWKNFRRTQWKN